MSAPEPVRYKQALVLRTDLKMRRGKEIAQGAHASMKVTLENLDHPDVRAWLDGPFAKIALGCGSEAEMRDLQAKAQEAGVLTGLITDAGRTEFGGVPTVTALAVGPAPVDKIDAITGHLKLR